MKRVRLHRILPALVFGASLSFSQAWAAPPQRPAGLPGAARFWAAPWDFASQLWRWAAGWGLKNGLSIDPGGAPSPQSDNGGSIDPGGTPATGPKSGGSIDPNGGPTSQPQNGPTIDPGGTCLTSSPGCGS